MNYFGIRIFESKNCRLAIALVKLSLSEQQVREIFVQHGLEQKGHDRVISRSDDSAFVHSLFKVRLEQCFGILPFCVK